jgi:hypothetical protein
MKKILVAAALLAGVSSAHAERAGRGNEARAKAVCKHFLTNGADFVTWGKCMNKHGLVWVEQSAAETSAASDDDARVRELENQNEQLRIAIQNEQLRALGQSIGQAVTNYGNSLGQPPVPCPPHQLRNGCY